MKKNKTAELIILDDVDNLEWHAKKEMRYFDQTFQLRFDLHKGLYKIRRKVAKVKSEEKNKDKFTKKRNWKQFRATINKEK